MNGITTRCDLRFCIERHEIVVVDEIVCQPQVSLPERVFGGETSIRNFFKQILEFTHS
jgi:hypothetical protein